MLGVQLLKLPNTTRQKTNILNTENFDIRQNKAITKVQPTNTENNFANCFRKTNEKIIGIRK